MEVKLESAGWQHAVQYSLPTIEATSTDAVAFLSRVHRGEDLYGTQTAVVLAYINPLVPKSEAYHALGTFPIAECLQPKEKFDLWENLHGYVNDVYWCINSTYLSKVHRGRHSDITGRPETRRTMKALRWLNAAYVDLDCYKIGRQPEAVYDDALSIMRDNHLPLPTLSVWSGRGVWLIWELANPVQAWPEKQEVLKRINQNLRQRFQHLGADPETVDTTRLCRIPGSVNSKSNSTVRWQTVPGSQPLALHELHDALGCPRVKTALTPRDDNRPANESRRARGYQRWQIKVNDVLRYVDYIRAVPEGFRYNTLMYLAALAKRAGHSAAEVNSMCFAIGRSRCNPPLPDDRIGRAVEGGLRLRHKLRDAAIIERLSIPERVGQGLGLSLFRRKYQRPAVSRDSKIAARRQKILGIIDQHGRLIPSREMVKLLSPCGFVVTHACVCKDYAALELRKASVNISACVERGFKQLQAKKFTSIPETDEREKRHA